MSKWEEKRFSDIANVIMGQSPSSSSYNEIGRGIPFLQGNRTFKMRYPEIDTYTTEPKKIAPSNSILMSVRAPVGDINIAPKELCIGRGLCSIESKIGRNDFLVYLLKYNIPRLKSAENGTTFTAVNGDDIRNLKLKVPSCEEQERIADILSTYDDLIESNTRRIELLEQTAQELYKEWFVRFRFPGHEKVKFENGLPEGWKVKNIGDLFDITSSKRVYLADYVEEGIPFYRSKEIIQLSQGKAITEPLHISYESYENFKCKFGAPKKNDILITSVGTIGVSYLADGHEFYFKDGNLTWIKSGSDKMLSVFLFQWLNSQGGKQQMLQSTIGTSQSALTIEHLKKIKLLIPNKELVMDYYNKAYSMIEQKKALHLYNQNLAAQRDLLLPRLMSGKLEV